ncbi:MAG: hypothetical protein LBC18_13715 [Opitutaceae bacterium]|jgi:hypothetical protein|nr:hypothetical protein [Opitutaceae bacterium]
MLSRRAFHFPAPALLLAVLMAGGCVKPPYDTPVKAEGIEQLNVSISFLARRLDAAETREIHTCLDEIRLSLMQLQAAGGSAAVNRALCQNVNGLPLKSIVELGYELRIERLEQEKAALEEDLAHKEKLRTRPGDTDSATTLANLKIIGREQLEKINERIGQSKKRLEAFRQQHNLVRRPAAAPIPGKSSA